MTDIDDWAPMSDADRNRVIADQLHRTGDHTWCGADCADSGLANSGREPPEANGDERPSSSWLPVDLTEVLDGSWQPPKPAHGRRTDGAALFYPGKSHSVVAESEAGKTWLACSATLDAINAGDPVVFIDFEDDQGSIVNRLLILGARRETIREYFHYIRPEVALALTDRELLVQFLTDARPVLGIVDGVTEGMEMHGLDPNQGVDAARFARTIIDRLTEVGAAAVSLDHPTKDGDNRRYASGTVHKLNGLSGAQYILEPVAPFGIGVTGRSRIRIAKDRPGQVRVNAEPGPMYWFGDLLLASKDEEFAEVSIEPPAGRDEAFRPTVLMGRVAQYLATHPGEADRTQRQIRTNVKGNEPAIIEALDALVAEDYVTTKSGARNSTIFTLAKPFEDQEDEADE